MCLAAFECLFRDCFGSKNSMVPYWRASDRSDDFDGSFPCFARDVLIAIWAAVIGVRVPIKKPLPKER